MRTSLVLMLLLLVAGAPSTSADTSYGPPEGARGLIVRIQGGAGRAPKDSGLPASVTSAQTISDVGAAGLAALYPSPGPVAVGLGAEISSWDLALPPQSFRVSTSVLQAQVEIGRTGIAHASHRPTPYALIGLGWAFNNGEPQTDYVFGGPVGVAHALKIDTAPTFELALGADVHVARGLGLDVHAGWRHDEPRYRFSRFGSPDASGTLHMSQGTVRLGIKLLLGHLGDD